LSQNNVMIVDDNPANLKLLEEMLRIEGYEVRAFPHGRLALAAAEREQPDLILLDITMPEMDGYEVCERLKRDPRFSGIPVIFLSALNEIEDKVKGFRTGGVDYVTKPFQFEEIRARVGAHVKLRHLQKQVENDNRRLEDLVQAQVKRIAEGQMATIFAIAKLAETRDHQTGLHLERIQTLCRVLAEGLSHHPSHHGTIGEAWIRNLYHASPLHDIGKVAIPDHILLKSDRLTSEEYAIMKTHTTLGAKTLQAVHQKYPDNEFIAMGIEVAQSHHERWDGGGYPDSLRGDQIPLCARILAVADCYDALRSERCYKLPVPHEATHAIILENSGTQFDPTITAVFCELSQTLRDVWNEMDESTVAVR
jgi:putative two-component system response regulator